MIIYPLNTPTSIGIEGIELRAVNAVAISQSPFTYKQQVIAYQGQRWEASVNIPSVRRDLAEDWNAFLLSLRGPTGTFLLGDPNAVTPRGSALSFRKNLLTYSEQFDNAAWTKSGATISTSIRTAPDGNNTADGLIEDTSLSTHSVRDNVSCDPSTTYTISVYVKFVTGGRGGIRVRLGDDTGFIADARVDLTNGTLYNPSPNNAISEYLGNGWLRVSVTGTTSASATSVSLTMELLETPDGPVTYQGDGTSDVAIWGAQLEAGSVATEYQPIANAYGPFVNGASQTGSELNIDGASPDEDAYLKAGDYIQLGSGSSSTLHKVLTDVSTNSAGEATIDIWPSIRTAPADNATVTIENCKGVFRLAQNVSSWSINNASSYGISFEAVEAIT